MGTQNDYKINEDGSATNNSHSESSGSWGSNNNDNNDNKGVIGCLIVAVVLLVVIIFGVASDCNRNGSYQSEPTRSHQQVSSANTNTTTTTQRNNNTTKTHSSSQTHTSSQPRYSTSCDRRPMDQHYSGDMLIPLFMDHVSHEQNGGITYYAENGPYIFTTIDPYTGSAYQFISEASSNFNSSYSAHKGNWAVDSGIYDNAIYYMKACKYDGLIYFAFFVAPKDDKTNASVYRDLTNIIFTTSNFPVR